MQVDQVHIHNVLIFLFHQRKNEKQALTSISDIYGNEHLTLANVRSLYRRFRKGDYSMINPPETKPPSKDDPLYDLIENDLTLTVEELALATKSTPSSVRNRLKAMGKMWKFERWMDIEIDEEERGSEMGVCGSYLSQLKNHSLSMDWITVGDVRWVYYDLPRKRKSKITKAILSLWWNSKGLVHYEMLQDQTITADTWIDQYKKALKKLERKKSFSDTTTTIMIDIPQPKISMDFITKRIGIRKPELMSMFGPTDAEPWVFYVYPAIKRNLEGKSFPQIEDLDAELKSFFTSQPKTFYSDGIKKLEERWNKVTYSDYVYVED